MTPEQEKEMQAHVQAIAAILYQNTPSEQLTSLEGIEIAVRQQILEHISPEIGSFLSAQLRAQKQDATGECKAASDSSTSRKSKRRSSK
ncbi:hypothetical protein [Pseudanabaena sp. PCC 6802]|uniref:hypothetical protein n=1 Tax=Pseudanabaena sp. PCC 6802 TaxID=118173 RepID=UPI000366CA17|nr:hypothetical protein [Pseudanabaena sp. PCC 6802]